MGATFIEFYESVPDADKPFVKELDIIFVENGCQSEIKEARSGYVATYYYIKDKKKISVMNYVFRKTGMKARIYARHVAWYEKFLDSLPNGMKQEIIKAGVCKKLSGLSECSPTCMGGYRFVMDGTAYVKCKNMAFMPTLCEENNLYIKEFVERELKYIDIEE